MLDAITILRAMRPAYRRAITGSPRVSRAGAQRLSDAALAQLKPRRLLTYHNPKTQKAEKGRTPTLTAVLHLLPADGREVFSRRVWNVCPHASEGCIAACLNTAGRSGIVSRDTGVSGAQVARTLRTVAFYVHREAFMAALESALLRHAKRARRRRMRPAARLNGTSDVAWERVAPGMLARLRVSGIVLYDYTKDPARAMAQPYHLTYSVAENTPTEHIEDLLSMSNPNVAVVFAGRELPNEYLGVRVVNGDATDYRPDDGHGVVVGLLAKGRAKKDTSGFVHTRGVAQ